MVSRVCSDKAVFVNVFDVCRKGGASISKVEAKSNNDGIELTIAEADGGSKTIIIK
jgi:hypothetical protein